MTWREIGFKVNKSQALVKKIWHNIVEKEQQKQYLNKTLPCPLCGLNKPHYCEK